MVVSTAFGRIGFSLPGHILPRFGYNDFLLIDQYSQFPPIAYHYDGNGFALSRRPIRSRDTAIELDQQFCSNQFHLMTGMVEIIDSEGYAFVSDMADVFFC